MGLGENDVQCLRKLPAACVYVVVETDAETKTDVVPFGTDTGLTTYPPSAKGWGHGQKPRNRFYGWRIIIIVSIATRLHIMGILSRFSCVAPYQ